MREPSGRGIRGLKHRGCAFALLVLALFGAGEAGAQAITRYVRDTGNINFTTTGGSLRSQPNPGSNACLVNSTSSQQLTGIPVGRTVRTAYLYWGASGSNPDTSVTLNGTTVTASRTFQRTFDNGTEFDFYGGFADVTSLVTGNGNYTFGNLNISVGSPWCGSEAVVGGWSLIVIYQGAGERLRAINLYDGLDYFYGSSVTQTPDGFRVPATNIDGRIAVFTLEGDPQNSTSSGGVSEALRFNGVTLDDGLVPTNSSPTVQQFDGTISTVGSLTSYGIDVDQYDVSALLSPGQTSATTVYSAGADLVLLMAQIVSATSDPAVNLSVTKTHTGTFVAGQQGVYTITVSNAAGMEREDNVITVTDTLPAGLTFVSGTGTGWTCAAVGQVVTCTRPPTLNAGASAPPLTLTVNVAEAAAANVTNTVTVSSASFDLSAANNTDTDPTATIDPTLTSNTKTVVDLNGGEVAPGDTLRYTITLNETVGGPAVNVSVTDHIPEHTTFAGFVSLPGGATQSFSAPPLGDNSRGVFTVSGITVPASGNAQIVFEVTVNAGVAPGETIDNTATVNNPNGPENSPNAPQLVVTPSLVPASGTKFLYLRQDAGGTLGLSRNRPSASDVNETVPSGGNDQWVIAPALQAPFTIPSGPIPVRLWLTRASGASGRNITVALSASGVGQIATQTLIINPTTNATPGVHNFSLNNPTTRNLPAGTTLTLTITNASGSSTITVWPNGNGGSAGGVPNNSRVELNTPTVINVDSVTTWNAAFNGGATQTLFYPGATVFIRALVSDPFGSFDIGSTTMTLLDPSNNVVGAANQPMTAQGAPATCNSTAAASCLYQLSYVVPASSPPLGTYTIRVTANEGVEGTVTDLGVGTFTVEIPQPSLTIVKTSTVLSDPLNLAVNPKRIPGAVVRYDIVTTNSGPGTVDANTLVLTDPIPSNSTLYVSTASGNPIVFVNGTTASGLTYNYPTNVSYSNVGASGPWTYTPSPDADGFDPLVRAIRVSPGGTMSAAGSGNPSFTIQFRVRVD
jgi:uncharacterized repeat protein (TIGR01451 family)